jgi:hypothetical protein
MKKSKLIGIVYLLLTAVLIGYMYFTSQGIIEKNEHMSEYGTALVLIMMSGHFLYKFYASYQKQKQEF